jgi:hypothetical protein
MKKVPGICSGGLVGGLEGFDLGKNLEEGLGGAFAGLLTG